MLTQRPGTRLAYACGGVPQVLAQWSLAGRLLVKVGHWGMLPHVPGLLDSSARATQCPSQSLMDFLDPHLPVHASKYNKQGPGRPLISISPNSKAPGSTDGASSHAEHPMRINGKRAELSI